MYGVFRRGGSLCERKSPLRDPKRTQGAIRPLTPELPVLNYFLGTVWRYFSSERFGVLLFSLSRCCNAGTRAAAKSLETIQRQRPSGHRRRPSRKPQQKLAGAPFAQRVQHQPCTNGQWQVKGAALAVLGDRKGAILPPRMTPFYAAAKGGESTTSPRQRRSRRRTFAGTQRSMTRETIPMST